MRRLLSRLLLPLGLAVAAITAPLAAAEPARATLLDEPPKVFAFDLAGGGGQRFPLLSVMQNASVERPGPFRLYLQGRWSRWQREEGSTLRWGATDESDAPSFWWSKEASAAPGPSSEDVFFAWSSRGPEVRELVLARSPLHARRIARAALPGWLTRLQPEYATGWVASTGPGFFDGDTALVSNGFDVLWSLPPLNPVVDWRCRRRPIQFIRFEGEHDRFEVVHCDGSVAPDALDRLSIIARPPGVPRPDGLLPDEPEAGAWGGHREWVDGVRVMHPRLLWVLQQIADAYPNRAIYVVSGYRRPNAPSEDDGESTSAHRSLHHEGRAVDIIVHGIDNVELFKTCRKLRDAGCGYYPNSKFVHVDARHANSGKAFWIDISKPGEPTQYVDAWPGVVEGGAMAWTSTPVPAPAPAP